MATLLSRDDFRAAVFARDGGSCVICREAAADAHHLLDRALWPDGGYYLDNGVAVCSDCHLQAERTLLTVEQLREAAGITRTLLPPGFDPSRRYDKWGNPFVDEQEREPGPLFFATGTQRILEGRFRSWHKAGARWIPAAA